MLSLFPQLLDFGFYAPTLLRVAIALLILVGSIHSFKHKKVVALSVIKIIASILLLIGLLTQLAALVLALAVIWEIWQAKKRGDGHFHLRYHLLKLAVLVALLLLGPGAWAFDWPL